MLKYNIKKPISDGRCVGIATHRLVDGTSMEVTISYKNAEGELLYPNTYRMACRKMKTYRTQKLASGIVLHIIPIADFEVET